ncbi:MAG TPA: protease modulator HflC [Candidatus Limnocylindrales bacterium]|nr:protease modulator HflC [Candidatus Limnocylindrales bacterium]
MDRRALPFLIALGLIIAAWNLAAFRVQQWMQAVVVQLGDPVRTVREPGLNFKLPFVQSVLYFDRRLLEYDASPREVLTKDKQQLLVDNYARWRILDPLLFYRTVRNEQGAASRLDDIIYSNVRENLGRHTFSEIISSSREQLMKEVTQITNERAHDFGIEIVDVRIKRADLPEKTEMNVFSRMRTERERLAKKFRAEGDEEARKIRSGSDKEVAILIAEARKQSEIRRGEGDAQAVKIFADAYGRDTDFYAFVRTLEAYRTSIKSGTSMILSPESDFLRYFRGSDPGTAR